MTSNRCPMKGCEGIMIRKYNEWFKKMGYRCPICGYREMRRI